MNGMDKMTRRTRNMTSALVFALGWLICRHFELGFLPFLVGHLTGGLGLFLYQGGING